MEYVQCSNISHCSDVIMGFVSIVDSTICAGSYIKENIKVPCQRPLWGEVTGNRWIPRTKGQWRRKCFHLKTPSYPRKLTSDNYRYLQVELKNTTNQTQIFLRYISWMNVETLDIQGWFEGISRWMWSSENYICCHELPNVVLKTKKIVKLWNYSAATMSIPWKMRPWFHVLPIHQQPWYWLLWY